MNRKDTERKGYILGPVSLGKKLSHKNREVTKFIAAANERIKTIPNPTIMFNQIILMESKGSSEIENIITTNDDLYKEVIKKSPNASDSSKTLRIRVAVKEISKIIDKNKSLLPKDIVEQGVIINANTAGFRPTLGTKIVNSSTNVIVHVPPKNKAEVEDHINKLLEYINQGGDNDPITDALLVHHAFEWIHPFIDGNGRIGRVLIGAYLKLWEEIDHIFLPISYFINKKRDAYYKSLKAMTDDEDYEVYLDYMYDVMLDAAKFTTIFARKYDENREMVKEILFEKFKKYSNSEFIDTIFYNAYTNMKILKRFSKLNERTIEKIMVFLEEKGIFKIKKEGRNKYYINQLITKEVFNG